MGTFALLTNDAESAELAWRVEQRGLHVGRDAFRVDFVLVRLVRRHRCADTAAHRQRHSDGPSTGRTT